MLWAVPTLLTVMDDVLAEEVVVAEDDGGAQCGEVLFHPHHLLLQYLLAGHLLLDSEQRQRQKSDQSD